MPKVDLNYVGVDRLVKDPRRAYETAEGKYKDRTDKLTPEQKYGGTPKAPDHNPFKKR